MNNDITCVILAGGLARRMGNIDKAFVTLANQPMLAHVVERVKPQTASIIINANGDPARFADWGLPVIADTIDDFPGPLAGVLAAMEWAQANQPQTKWVVSVPVDTPFVPANLVKRLSGAITDNQADMACARSNGRNHPVVGMWPVALADNLRRALKDEALRKVDLWTGRFKLAVAEFATVPVDPFFNINRPEDIVRAHEILRSNG